MKKVLWIVLALLIIAGTFAACNNNNVTPSQTGTNSTEQGASQSAANEPVSISILQYKVEIVDQLNAAIEAYRSVAPNVTITLETVGGGDDIGPTLKARLQSGTLPTIYNVGGPADVELYEDYLEDLSDQPWVQNAAEGTLNNATKDGKIYGMPYAIEGFGFVINREIFETAGVDVTTMNSFEGIENAFKKVQEGIKDGSLKEKYPELEAVVELPAGESWVLGDHAANIALAPEFEEDPFKAAQATEVKWTYGDAYKDYIDLQIKYSKWADNPSGALAVTYADEVQGGIALERVACIQQGNWIYNDVATIDETVANKLTMVAAPVKGYKEDSIFTLIPMYWCVSSQAADAERQAAKDFLNWLYHSEEGMRITVEEFGFIPAFTSYGDMYPSDPLAQSIKTFVEEGKTMFAPFKGYPDGWATNVIGARVQGYIEGKLTWEEALKQAGDEWSKSRANRGSTDAEGNTESANQGEGGLNTGGGDTEEEQSSVQPSESQPTESAAE